MSPADLTKPFAESCCDGGECSTSTESAQPCGCDMGAPVPHFCTQHELTPIKEDIHFLLKRIRIEDLSDAHVQAFDRLQRWSKS